jgi:hypothetical protein
MTAQKFYLGDGAYAEFREDGSIVLTAENGIYPDRHLVLDPFVLRNFLGLLRRIWPEVLNR